MALVDEDEIEDDFGGYEDSEEFVDDDEYDVDDDDMGF